MRFRIALIAMGFILSFPAMAQKPQPPAAPKIYSGSIGMGFAMTGGNTSTKNFNLSFEITRDPKSKNITKTEGLYLRTSAGGTGIADLLRLGFRDDYLLSKRISLYGALGYLRDPFKQVTYMLNLQGGVGYRVYSSDRLLLAVNGGAGGVWEKDEGQNVHASGTLNAGQNFSFRLSNNARVTESITGLWKTSATQNITGLWRTSDLSDALYSIRVALVTSIVKRVDLKLEFMDEYKNVTPSVQVKNNDTAFIMSFLCRF
jgi:putative salt-induced outer membrane protein YdiY